MGWVLDAMGVIPELYRRWRGDMYDREKGQCRMTKATNDTAISCGVVVY
jgi:hypothetical protein